MAVPNSDHTSSQSHNRRQLEAGDAGQMVTKTKASEENGEGMKEEEGVEDLLMDMMENAVDAMIGSSAEMDIVKRYLEVIMEAVEIAADERRRDVLQRSPD